MVGMGHKLSPQEANAGVSVFGGGAIFNPQAGGNLPGTQISIADATSLVKGGLTQDLANAGLSRVMGSKGSYQTGTGYIIHNLGTQMVTGVATNLLKNQLGNTSKWVALSLSGAQGGMSRNPILGNSNVCRKYGRSKLDEQ